MLYRIGTEKELDSVKDKLPKQVYEDLTIGIVVLDSEYGEDRDYLQEGGYSVIIETTADLPEFKKIVPYDTYSCEWAVKESRNCGYLCALYIMNNDFYLLMPVSKFLFVTC